MTTKLLETGVATIDEAVQVLAGVIDARDSYHVCCGIWRYECDPETTMPQEPSPRIWRITIIPV